MKGEVSVTIKKAEATRYILVSFKDQIVDTELLTGTPTAEEYGTSALTISDVALNTLDVGIHGLPVKTNQGVGFFVAGGVARTDYTIRVTVGTDTSPGQTLVKDIRLKVI